MRAKPSSQVGTRADERARRLSGTTRRGISLCGAALRRKRRGGRIRPAPFRNDGCKRSSRGIWNEVCVCDRLPPMNTKNWRRIVLVGNVFLCAAVTRAAEARPQGQQIVWSKQEKSILEDIRTLRKLSEG